MQGDLVETALVGSCRNFFKLWISRGNNKVRELMLRKEYLAAMLSRISTPNVSISQSIISPLFFPCLS